MSAARAFGELLRAHGFDAAAAARPGARLSDPVLRRAANVAALDPSRMQGALQRLFALGEPGPLPPEADAAALEELGVLRRDGDVVVPLVQINEVEGLLVCSDADMTRPDAVAPVSSSTRLTAAFTPLIRVDAALDVGCGQGAHALRLSRHARRVVATDVSERALWFTRLNAELNGVSNLETRHGDFLEPVRGERFGIAVCNAPYVIAPETGMVYRDSPLRGDALSRRLLEDLPEVVQDGGFGVLQGNWAHRAGAPWHPPVPCTALLARIETYEPREYALAWTAADHPGDPEGFLAAVARWTAEYRELGIEAITTAMVVLHAGSFRRPWATTIHGRPAGLGRRLPALFAADERLDSLEPGSPLRPAPGLAIERGERCALEHPATPSVRFEVTPAVADAVAALPGPTDPALWGTLTALVRLGFLELG
jgi:SAM-dependent methyltransferase